jgi:hypothetical protein
MALLSRFPKGGWRTKAARTHSTSMVRGGHGRCQRIVPTGSVPCVPDSGVLRRWSGEARQLTDRLREDAPALFAHSAGLVLGPELSNRGGLVANPLPLRWALGGS